jgi:ABC-type antimicrobial peptide transport system permease subunit
MTGLLLVRRSLAYHWRTNVAVVLGVAAAVSVLGGALLVGDSVRGSLRHIALARLGNAHVAVTSAGFFREEIAVPLAGSAEARPGGVPYSVAPLVIASGFVTHEPSGKRAGNVVVYGVDERFWTFHGVRVPDGPAISQALASELGAASGDVLLVRLQRPSEIPIESLFGRKEEIGRTIRLTLTDALPRERLGEFSLRQQQAELRAVFAPLRRIQRDLGVGEQVNTVLLSGAEANVSAFSLQDFGIKVRPSEDKRMVVVDAASGILSEATEASIRAAAGKAGYAPIPVFTYLANTMRIGDRVVPYSLITATDLSQIAPSPQTDGVYLNDWTAAQLGARPGDPLEIEYYRWDANAGLTTHTATFAVRGIVPIAGLAADRQLAPEYPGITGAESLADWDPPFPIDLSRVRPVDEKYWDDHRATPKAFIDFARGRELWQTRYGGATSLRFAVPAGVTVDDAVARLDREIRAVVKPEAAGIAVLPVRAQAEAASAGATDFGEYFTYFSFFLVVSALMLAILFFRLGVEQRLRQIGVMRAAGFPIAKVRALLLLESVVLAAAGGVLGVLGAIGYGHIIVHGLRTWWIGAVGTSDLSLFVSPLSLLAGALGGIITAVLCVVWSLRAVGKQTPRSLLSAQSIGQEPAVSDRAGTRNGRIAMVFTALAVAAIAAGFLAREAQAGAFFGAGGAALLASMFFLSSWLRSRSRRAITGHGALPLMRMGFRSAAFRPARSVLSAALIAAAAFIIVSVDAFRKGGGEIAGDRSSGTGGYTLIASSELPLLHNPNDAAGRDALIVQAPEFERVTFTRFRLRPGDDASCLNLYRPTSPTIVAPDRGFLEQGRFSFSSSLAETDAERANPWLLLNKGTAGGAVPVIADATSLQYVLHLKVGDTFSMDIGAAQPLVLQFVAALSDSVLQGELVMSEDNFTRHFPSQQGYRFFLIDAPGVATREAAAQLAGALEKDLDSFGFDAVTAAERLEAFHRVENTYLSTFQSLGGLGLLLGTIGLAAVMFRNVLERRRELAVLRAVGYNRWSVTQMILAEAVLLLGAGLGAGVLSAVLAVAPAWLGRSGARPGATLALLLAAVAVAGVFSSMIAARAALRTNLLESLRAE